MTRHVLVLCVHDQVRRTEANYWKVDDPTVYTPDKQPVFIGYFSSNEKDMEMKIYSIPILEYPGLLKVCVCACVCVCVCVSLHVSIVAVLALILLQ